MTADDYRALQRSLVDLLRQNGTVTSEQVANAFLSVPRHIFLADEPLERAYQDIAIQVRADPQGRWTSSSSQPSIMAIMLEQLDLRPGMRVLEIGAGTGYNAALLANLVGPQGAVTAVDIQPDLVEAARAHLREAGLDWVHVFAGDGGYGWPEDAPYDRVILTASSFNISPAWRAQLSPGGRIVLPLDLGGVQVSAAFEKRGEELVTISLFSCGFMPLQGSFAQSPVWLEVGPRLNVICPRAPALDGAALAGWLAQPGEAIPAGMRMKAEELWSGLIPWLVVNQPDRCCMLVADDDEAPDGPSQPLAALQSPLITSPGGQASRVWLVLPAAGVGLPGAALLRRSPGAIAMADAIGMAVEDGFDLHVLPLGEGLAEARGLVETLRAWDAAGRPRTTRLQIRAVDAELPAHPRPGERLLQRPWTNFLLRYHE